MIRTLFLGLGVLMVLLAIWIAMWFPNDDNSDVEMKHENIHNERELAEEGQTFAVLVAGSPGYENYAMQADVCDAYQLLAKGGVKKTNMIVIMADDVANNPQNFYPGRIIHKPNGADVYRGVGKDYTGKNMNIKNLRAVLTGNKKAIRWGWGSGKVLSTTSKDRIFLFYAAHGLPGSIQLGDTVLESKVLFEMIQQMFIEKRYKKMVIYVSSCHSGSVFARYSDLYKKMNVYIMTSSNDKEYSYQMHNYKGINMGTMFGIYWIRDSQRYNRTTRTIAEQYAHLKETLDRGSSTERSTVMQYGDQEISEDTLDLYQGFN